MSADYTTVAVILYKPKILSNGEHPLMLRVTKSGVRKYLSIGISCRVEDWDIKKQLPKKSHPHKGRIDSIISNVIRRCNDKIMEFKDEDKDFTPDVLLAALKNPDKRTTVFEYFDLKIKNFVISQQIGNSRVYIDTYNQIKTFRKNKDFTFSQLDYTFLLNLETWFKSKGLADTTMSLRFRTLRALFKSAILEGYTKQGLYPFENFKISARFSSDTKKRAISKEDLKKLEALKLDPKSADFEAQKYFLFSYYCQGINFIDMAYLKWNQLIDDRMYYNRAKTGKSMYLKVPEPAITILEYWKPATHKANNSYIFPILDESKHVTALQKYNRIEKVRRRYNKSLKHIAELAKVKDHITTYVARHTFATVLKKSGVSEGIISETMGHKTEAITRTYLKDFDNIAS
jgi:integrase